MAFGTPIQIGMSIGTTNITIDRIGKGIVLREPMVAAFDRKAHAITAIGEAARRILQKDPENITAVRPIRRGTITNRSAAKIMLEYFLQEVIRENSLKKPKIYVNIPVQAKDEEKNSLKELLLEAGAGNVVIIEDLLLDALGFSTKLIEKKGYVIVDIGGGTSEAGVIGENGTIIIGRRLNIAGNALNDSIIEYVRDKYNLKISYYKAEAIKRKIGTCDIHTANKKTITVSGRNFTTGSIEAREISSIDIAKAMEEYLLEIYELIRGVVEVAPPELRGLIQTHGILLTGGGACIDGIEEWIEKRIGIVTTAAENALFCTAIGTAHYSDYKKHKVSRK